MGRHIVSLSGGMDSATVLGYVMKRALKEEVEGVGFYYGSKHNPYENTAAKQVAGFYGIPCRFIDLKGAMAMSESNLLATGGEIPEGHYEAESMKQTVVPGRNLIFMSVLAGYAMSQGGGSLYFGIHQGDHAIYPDCRMEFFNPMKEAIYQGTDRKVMIHAPFLGQYKAHILMYGLGIDVPYHYTRTCYKDQPVACGKCGACQERLDAFAQNNQADPIDYISREIMAKA